MNSFEYLQPNSLVSATKALSKKNNSAILAGGTDLLGLMKDDIYNPDYLINLKNLNDLNFIKHHGDQLKIGALTKLDDILQNEFIKEKFNILHEAIKQIATPQLRNVGTIGGNICQRPRCFYFRQDYDCIRKGGDICYAEIGNNKYHCIIGGGPCYIVHASDTAVALLALNAKFNIYNGKDYKIVDAENFFILPNVNAQKENILKENEILTEIIIPISDRSVSKFIKIKERGAWDFALVSIGGVFNVQENKINYGKIAFGGVAPIPWLEKDINKLLNNFIIKEDNIDMLINKAFIKAEKMEMNGYKILMAKNLIRKLFFDLFNT